MRILTTIALLIITLQISAQSTSVNGHIHTPKGHLHGLVIFVGFNNDTHGDRTEPLLDDANNDWKYNELPEWAIGQSNYLFDANTGLITSGKGKQNLSKYFYQMSLGKFLFTADIFPEQVMIDANYPIRQKAYSNTKKVYAWIKENYPDFNWSKYDQRENMPKWNFDNSSSNPDKRIDYVYLIYRNLTNKNKGAANIPAEGKFIQVINGEEQGFKIGMNSGHYASDCSANPFSHQHYFLHEFAHRLYKSPHYFGANDAHGNHFYTSNGWGMMGASSGTQIFNCSNSWERWYLGWIEIKHDLETVKDNGVYVLRDFVSTGDAIRIKLPHCDQHLWLEYHSGNTYYDQQRPGMWPDKDVEGIPFPKPPKGLMAFVESMPGTRKETLRGFTNANTNNFKMLNANGNFDYYISEDEINNPPRPKNLWGNILFDFNTVKANPLGAHNTSTFIQYDYKKKNKKPGQDGVIHYDAHWNGAYNEALPFLAKKDGVLEHYFLGKGTAFVKGDRMGIDENPVITNHQKYYQKQDSLSPILLNGLSVEVLNVENGLLKVKISFDDTEINKKTRFSGNIRLNDLSGVEEDLVVNSKRKLLINKSGTPSRSKEIEQGSRDFVNPSLFVIEEGAVMRIKRKGKVQVKQGSTLIIREKGKLIIEKKGKLKVKKGSKLIVEGELIRE